MGDDHWSAPGYISNQTNKVLDRKEVEGEVGRHDARLLGVQY